MSLPTATKTKLGFVRWYPGDLAVASLLTIVAYVGVTALPAGSELRLAFALPLVLFLPGYALVSVLFPTRARAPRRGTTTETERFPRGIDTIERLGLAFALSLTIGPLLTMGLALTRWGLTTTSAAGALAIVAIGLAQLGVVRRLHVPKPDRYVASPRSALRRINPAGDGSAVETASAGVLALAVVGAALTLLVALVSPMAGAGFTELGVFTEDENGELVADDYPDELEPGESAPLVVTIENNEGTETAYTVVAQQQTVEDGQVTDRTELDRLEATVADGETERIEHAPTPTSDAEGETVRITYLLYEGDVPEEPTRENADEDVFVWVTVTDGGDGDEA